MTWNPPHALGTCIQPGDVLGVSTRWKWWNPATWLSGRIQSTTASPFNHVGILVPSTDGEWTVVEALFRGGVVSRPLSAYTSRPDRYRLAVGTWPAPLDSATRWAICSHARAALGAPYDWKRIMQIRGLQLLLGAKRAASVVVPGDWPTHHICSGLVIRAYASQGLTVGSQFSGPGSVLSHLQIIARWKWTTATDRAELARE